MKSINNLDNLEFQKDGLEIHDLFSEDQINNLAVDFYNRILLQAYKIGVTKNFNFKNYDENIIPDEIDNLVREINEKNKRSLDFAVQELRECPSFYNLISKKFLEISSNLLNCPDSLLKIHIDGILVNIPSNILSEHFKYESISAGDQIVAKHSGTRQILNFISSYS